MGFAKTIDQEFQEFHRANPGTYDLLVSLALEKKAQGLTRYGMDALFNELRWHHKLKPQGQRFKLNDHLKRNYAEMIMEREPDLAGFFELRKKRRK